MKICARCVLDEKTPDIVFDQYGECNYCKLHDVLDQDFPNYDSIYKTYGKFAELVFKFILPWKPMMFYKLQKEQT